MKLPTKKYIKKLTPDEAKVLLDKLDDCRMLVINNWHCDSRETEWLEDYSDEVSWSEFNEGYNA